MSKFINSLTKGMIEGYNEGGMRFINQASIIQLIFDALMFVGLLISVAVLASNGSVIALIAALICGASTLFRLYWMDIRVARYLSLIVFEDCKFESIAEDTLKLCDKMQTKLYLMRFYLEEDY